MSVPGDDNGKEEKRSLKQANPYDIGAVYLVGKYDKAAHLNALQDGMGSNPYSVGL